MVINFKLFITVLLSVNLLACAPVSAQKNVKSGKIEESITYQEVGKASFYANKFIGRKTASGDIFRQNAKTAAHKKLPFGTKVKVTNLKNGAVVVVTINDRGPFIRGRIIDLSRSAFKAINGLDSGVIQVRIEVIA